MHRPNVSAKVHANIERDLAHARVDPLNGFDAARVLSRLEAASAGVAPRPRPMARRRPPRLVWLAAALICAAAAAALLLQTPEPPVAPPAAPVSSAVVAPHDAPRPSAVVPSAAPSAAPGIVPPAATPSSPSTRRRAPGARLDEELRQLSLVREALGSDPATALALADAGHVEFKAGVMREEREALAVMALSRLSRPAAFEARARRFLQQYPQSAFHGRITALLPASSSPAP